MLFEVIKSFDYCGAAYAKGEKHEFSDGDSALLMKRQYIKKAETTSVELHVDSSTISQKTSL